MVTGLTSIMVGSFKKYMCESLKDFLFEDTKSRETFLWRNPFTRSYSPISIVQENVFSDEFNTSGTNVRILVGIS